MIEQEKLTPESPDSSLVFNQDEKISLGEMLRATNAELEAILQRIQASREESARLAAQSEEVMSKLRATWLC